MARLRPEPAWWSDLSTGYLRSIVRRGLRPNTRRAYYCELVDFGRWLYRAGVQGLNEVDRQHIEAWQDEIQDRLAPGTQRLAAVVVRGALRWAADQELPLSKPTLWLRVVQPRIPRLKPRPIPLHDLEAILLHLEAIPHPTLLQLRTRALFWLIFSSGARISEALSLTRLSVIDGTALVTQKGGSEHCLMISAKATEAVNDYLNARRDTGLPLFVSYMGPRILARLEPLEAQKSWNQLCKDLGIARFTSHRIRHSTATELLRRRVDSLIIAKHLGHRGLGSIAGYAEVALDTRREAMDALDGRLAS